MTSSNEHLPSQQVATSATSLVSIYEQLAAISREAFKAGHYEVAFHALSAAVHCANDLEDEERLLAMEQEAEAQKALIDQVAPEHRMSSQTAEQRGGKSMYAPLIQQARVHRRQVKINSTKSEGSTLT